MIRVLILILILFFNLEGKENKKRIIVAQIGDNLYRMRIYFNHENPYQTRFIAIKKQEKIKFTLPIPDRYQVKAIREYIQYLPGLGTSHEGSYLLGYLNGNLVSQSKLVTNPMERKIEGLKFDIPIDKLYEGYNSLELLIIQSPIPKSIPTSSSSGGGGGGALFSATQRTVSKCQQVVIAAGGGGGGAPSEIWTQIDTENSYIELDFSIREFEEKLSSIKKFMFDNKSMIKGKINFVLPKTPSENDFYNYSFFSYYISKVLGFRDIDIFVSTEINDNMHNVIIAKRQDLKKVFEKYRNSNIFKKLEGNINILRNPNSDKNGILVITGENQKKIESSLFQLLDKNLDILDVQSIKVADIQKPSKAKPFSTNGFIQFDKHIKFSDATLTNQDICSDSFVSTFRADFKLYPIVNFDNSQDKKIEILLKYFVPNTSAIQLVCNVYINGVFAYQSLPVSNSGKMSKIFSEYIYFSPSLLTYGDNRIDIELVKYKKSSTAFGLESIQTAIKEDSYFTIPKGKPKVELPSLGYITKMAFPFSIYPDLQNTGILITNFYAETIASAFQLVFQFGRIMKTPPYYLTVTYDINKILDKDIISIGSQIQEYSLLYKNAPIKFIDNGIIKEIYDSEHNRTKSIKEIADFSDILIAQTYRSIFNPKRIIFELSSISPATLLKGMHEGFLPIQLANLRGDVWFYNVETEEQQSFRYGKKYIVDELIEGFKNPFDSDKYRDIEDF